jgi:O-antigen ligase
MLNKKFYFILALPALFLLVNEFPYLMILSVVLLVILGIIYFFINKSITKYHNEIITILIIIFAYFIFSYFFSGQTLSNFLSYNFIRYDGNFFFAYLLFFIYAIPFFDYEKVISFYFKFIFHIFTLFSIFGLSEYFLNFRPIMISRDPYVGNYFHALNLAHNATGSVYAMASIFALVFFLKEKNIKTKLVYCFVLLFCAIGLFLTKSRGSYLGFFVAAVFILWFNYRSIKKFFISILFVLVPSVALVLITGVYKRFIQIFDLKAATDILRLDLWRKAWYLFSQSPLFGIGFGRYNDISNYDRLKGIAGFFAFYLDPIFVNSDANSHNSYLQFLTETGLFGLSLLILFCVVCFIILIKAYNNSANSFARKAYLSAIGGIIALFVLSFTENYFSSTTVMICISMVTSLSIGLWWQESRVAVDLKHKNILIADKN